jgi:hypothetical protein
MIRVLGTGLVYRNPKPNLRAVHTWHPSLVLLDSGELLASFDVGQAVESMDYHTVLSRSGDGGREWSTPTPIFRDTAAQATHTVRLGRTRDGLLTAFGTRFHREDPEEGLTNRANLGMVRTDLILLISRDAGRTWYGPRQVTPPLVGPSFEVCHSIIELADGRWLWPTSTWKGWSGDAPNGMKCVALVSHDRGMTWPDHLDVMDDYANGIIHWEVSLRQMADGRLLAVAWAFHEPTGATRPTPYSISEDGRAFSAPRLTGLRGQTAKVLPLDGDGVLCVYRRNDRPGLWAALAQVTTAGWRILDEAVLWQGAASGMSGVATASDELAGLRFGYPSMARMPDGEVLVAFWCLEDAVHNIRWIRLALGK